MTPKPEPEDHAEEPDIYANPAYRRRRITMWTLLIVYLGIYVVMVCFAVDGEEPPRALWWVVSAGVLVTLAVMAIRPINRYLGLNIPDPAQDERDHRIYQSASTWTLNKLLQVSLVATFGVMFLPPPQRQLAAVVVAIGILLFITQNLRSWYLRKHM